MPLPITLAHDLTRLLAAKRKSGAIKYLRPDGKSQVTVEYDGHKPVRVDAVVISTQHDDDIPLDLIRREVTEQIIDEVIPRGLRDDKLKIYVNPTGRFVIGGPMGDAGLTGRKIIADTYGGMARHGGGAFSGKDPTKVDRSAAYAARYVAKNIVAAGLAERCEMQVAYAIGVAHPVSVLVETFGTGKIDDEKIAELVKRALRPAPGGDHPPPRPAPADLQADRVVRPLRPPRARPAVGAPGQGRGAARRLGPQGHDRPGARAADGLAPPRFPTRAEAPVVTGASFNRRRERLRTGERYPSDSPNEVFDVPQLSPSARRGRLRGGPAARRVSPGDGRHAAPVPDGHQRDARADDHQPHRAGRRPLRARRARAVPR